MSTYRSGTGEVTHRIPVELAYDEAIALAEIAATFPEGPARQGLERVRRALAIEAPEFAEEPEWWRGEE